MSCTVDGCFNKRLVFPWVRIVLRYSLICLFMLMRQTSFKSFTRIKIENYPRPLVSNFRYTDDVLSLINSRFGDYQHRIYLNELEVKDTTASYLDLHLEIDIEGRIKWKLHVKRGDFTFPIVSIPFISSNILSSPTFGVYSSQSIRYSRACVKYRQGFSG